MPHRGEDDMQTWCASTPVLPLHIHKVNFEIGVTKTYKLTYEATKIEHALFNCQAAKNRWRIGANVLKSFLDYFGANTEQLDIYAEDGRAAFTSYTEKIANGKEILKHPLETSIALDTLDFEEFVAEEKMHIAISVKDFKAIVLHAETLKASVQAAYSFPTRPLQLAYYEHGMRCEYTLMTIGDYRGSTTPAPTLDRNSSAPPRDTQRSRQTSIQPTQAASAQPTQTSVNRTADRPSNGAMPPPSQPASRSFQRFPETERAINGTGQGTPSQKPSRPSPPPPKASVDPNSLFVPVNDDDRQWDEANYGDDEETVGWDPNADNGTLTFRNAQGAFKGSSRDITLPAWPEDADQRIPPTQSLAGVRSYHLVLL
ncbi:MAG: hypothetical protein Q9170_004781 [Blastenia crenularia]